MTYSQMFSVAKEAGLSPEKMAKLLGVSGMTLRRWRDQNQSARLPKVYASAFQSAVRQMVVSGQLSADSPLVPPIISEDSALPFRAILKSMGFRDVTRQNWSDSEGLILGLSQIGGQQARVDRVNKSKRKVFSFSRLSAEWSERVRCLWTAAHSADLAAIDKLVAYGALFYLITPLDLIPDTIPGLGLVDDFLILGVAAAYYLKRFPRVVRD